MVFQPHLALKAAMVCAAKVAEIGSPLSERRDTKSNALRRFCGLGSAVHRERARLPAQRVVESGIAHGYVGVPRAVLPLQFHASAADTSFEIFDVYLHRHNCEGGVML